MANTKNQLETRVCIYFNDKINYMRTNRLGNNSPLLYRIFRSLGALDKRGVNVLPRSFSLSHDQGQIHPIERRIELSHDFITVDGGGELPSVLVHHTYRTFKVKPISIARRYQHLHLHWLQFDLHLDEKVLWPIGEEGIAGVHHVFTHQP